MGLKLVFISRFIPKLLHGANIEFIKHLKNQFYHIMFEIR